MITWVTVWVLTVTVTSNSYGVKSHYQLQYGKQSICEKQIKNHIGGRVAARCDFQQIPVVK